MYGETPQRLTQSRTARNCVIIIITGAYQHGGTGGGVGAEEAGVFQGQDPKICPRRAGQVGLRLPAAPPPFGRGRCRRCLEVYMAQARGCVQHCRLHLAPAQSLISSDNLQHFALAHPQEDLAKTSLSWSQATPVSCIHFHSSPKDRLAGKLEVSILFQRQRSAGKKLQMQSILSKWSQMIVGIHLGIRTEGDAANRAGHLQQSVRQPRGVGERPRRGPQRGGFKQRHMVAGRRQRYHIP